MKREISPTVHCRNPLKGATAAILGSPFLTWKSLHDLFARDRPIRPGGVRPTPTRIVGDQQSAVAFFANDVGLFGPSKMRAFRVVTFWAGPVVRWINYWNDRHFGIADLDAAQLPEDQFRTDLRESTVGETAASAKQRVAQRPTPAAAAKDHAVPASLVFSNASLTDLIAQVQIVGPRSMGLFLSRAGAELPFVGPGIRVRNVVDRGVRETC